MSNFVDHLVDHLAEKTIPSARFADLAPLDLSVNDSQQRQILRSILTSLKPPTSLEPVQECFSYPWDIFYMPSNTLDKEEEGLKKAIFGRIIVAVYAAALRTYLAEATEAEKEAEWWDNIERSRVNLAWYLLQTLPSRLWELSRTIVRTFKDKNIPLRLSKLNPTTFRQVFPSVNDFFRPNAAIVSLFPHLRGQPHVLSFSLSPSRSSSSSTQSVYMSWLATVKDCFSSLMFAITLPINLARQECITKRKELEQLRDQRAEALGMLSEMRGVLSDVLMNQSISENSSFHTNAYRHVVDELYHKFGVGSTTCGPFETLHTIVFATLPAHRRANESLLNVNRLIRPNRLTLIWPNLILSPFIILYGYKYIYASRASVLGTATDAWSTIRGFWQGWLVDPLKDVLKTVRAGGEGGVIVQKEALAADLASLERMVLSLAQDELHYSADQLSGLSSQLRQGDLTSVLKMYEQDIKSPVKSALMGTLLRSLFIQVQKAKVDIDQALFGIDKLLKSQELTFAFVGVAPALALVYITAGLVRGIWLGGKGRGLYGGRKKRTTAWIAMRRIEQLLIAQPQSSATANIDSSPNIPPLTSGLLLLSVTRLRYFAEKYLPPSSRIQEGFLEDIKDLEDPALGRAEKLRVVDRMWRCWGASLRWSTDER